MLSVHEELRALIAALGERQIPYALCGGLALAVFGHPRATLDIDLVGFHGSATRILAIGRELGFALPAAPMSFAQNRVHIDRLTKADADDVLSLDVLTLAPEIESALETEERAWSGGRIVTLDSASLILLKRLRGSPQDLADIEKLS